MLKIIGNVSIYLSTIIFLAGCGESQNTSNKTLASSAKIYGTWERPQFSIGSFTSQSRLTFEAEKVTVKLTCSLADQSASTTISSPARVTDSQISILENAETPAGENAIGCRAILFKGEATYSFIDDNTLSMTRSGETPRTLTRVK